MTCRVVLFLTVCLFAQGAASAENLVSGPQAGEKIPGRFTAVALNGENAGKTICPVELPGYDMAALIFISDASDPLIELVRKIDEQLKGMPCGKLKPGVFIVITSEDPAVKRRFAKEDLKHVVLCSGPDKGLKKYELAEEAAQTAMVCHNGMVKANHAFRKGELDDGWTTVILKALVSRTK